METITLVLDSNIEGDLVIGSKEFPNVYKINPETWEKLKSNSTTQAVDSMVKAPGREIPIAPGEELENYVPPTTVKSELKPSRLFDFLVKELPEFQIEYLPQPNLRLSDRRTIKIGRDGKSFTMIDAGSPNKKAITQIKEAWKKANNS